MGRNILILLGLVLLLLAACSPTPQATPLVITQLVEQAPTQVVVVTPTAVPSATPAPTPTQRPKQPSLFRYISLQWTEEYLPVIFGPAIYYVDFEQIRADLGFPAPGEPIPADQVAALYAALNTSIQGLPLFPESLPVSRSARDQIGWDFTDIQQVLVIPLIPFTVMQGVFDRAAIAEALESSGYQQSMVGSVLVFSPPQYASTYYLITPDIIALTNSAEYRDLMALRLQGDPLEDGTASSYPTIQKVLNDPAGIWGAVFSPSSDMHSASLQAQEYYAENPEILEFIEDETGGSLIVNSPNWDFMAISFKGVEDLYRLQFLYRYATHEEAASEQELARTAIIDGPSYLARGGTWSEMVTLESVAVQDEHLIVTGTTRMATLIGRAVSGRDYGFLPLPPVE